MSNIVNNKFNKTLTEKQVIRYHIYENKKYQDKERFM